MTDAKIMNEDPLSMTDLQGELKKIEKRDEEPSFRVTKVQEYLGQFLQLKNKEHEELVKKIAALEIPRLREQHIIKIVDIMPATADDIKLVLQGYPISISNDNLKKIAGVVKEYIKAKKS